MLHLFKHKDLNIAVDAESGAVHLVSGIVYDMLLRIPDRDCTSEAVAALAGHYPKDDLTEAAAEIDSLIEDGLLFSVPLPEQLVTPERRNPIVKAMCLHIAHDCNMRCVYCFAGTGEYSGRRAMLSSETARNAIDFLLENSGNRTNLEIDFFGGEPLMNFDVVKDSVCYGRMREKEYAKKIRFTLTTNGLALDDEKIDFLNEHIDNVIISLDGRPCVNDRMRRTVTGEGSYDIIVPKLQHFAKKREEAGKLYYVRGTFTSHNKDFVSDIEHLASLGFSNISVEPVVGEPSCEYALSSSDIPELTAEYDKLTDLIYEREQTAKPLSFFHFNIDLSQGPCVYKRAAGCGAGTEYVAIAANGDIYPCHQFVGNLHYLMGNVNPDATITEGSKTTTDTNRPTTDPPDATITEGSKTTTDTNSPTTDATSLRHSGLVPEYKLAGNNLGFWDTALTRLPRMTGVSTQSDVFNIFNAAHIYSKPACRECWAKFWCSGGCHANAVHINGDIVQPYELGCILERKRLECAIALEVMRELSA